MRKPFFRPVEISLRNLYSLRLPIESLFPVEEHQAETKIVTVCYKSHHAAHEPHRVPEAHSAKDIVSEAGLTAGSASAVWALGQHQSHVLLRNGTRLGPMRVFSIIERPILDDAVLPHGYLYHPKKGLGFRL